MQKKHKGNQIDLQNNMLHASMEAMLSNMLWLTSLLELSDVGVSKRGSKWLPWVCCADMLPTCWQTCRQHNTKSCWQGYRQCRADMSLADMLASCWPNVGCRHVKTRVKMTGMCLLGRHVADMLPTCCTSINQVEQLICNVKKIKIMIGKRTWPPKKSYVLFLLVLMYHLNSIPLSPVSTPHYCLHHQHKHQQGTIHYLSLCRIHILFLNQKWFPWDGITEDETFLFCKHCPLATQSFFFCASSSQSSTYAQKTSSVPGSFNASMSTPKLLSCKSKLILSSPNIALCHIASNFSMRSHWTRACDIFKETNKMVLFSANSPLR